MSNGIPPEVERLATMGMRVIPVHGVNGDGTCTCGRTPCPSGEGKHPRISGWQREGTSDLDQIASWAGSWSVTNWGVVADNLVVIDVDPRNGGDDSMVLLRHMLPATLTQDTGGGGVHYVYRLPEGVTLHNGRKSWRPGVDVLSGNTQFLVAPSRHKSGGVYSWRDSTVPIETLPSDVLSILSTGASSTTGGSTTASGQDLSGVINGLPEGERDRGLFAACCRWRRLGLGRGEVEALAQLAASRCVPPFPTPQAMAKVEQAFKQDHDDDLDPAFVAWAEGAAKAKPASILDAMRAALLAPSDLESLPDPEWLIDGILPKSSMSVLYGSPGLGKTFIALDWALRIGGGLGWLGRDVKAGTVLYVYAEGVYGLKNRRAAWVQSTGLADPVDVRFFPRAVPLLDDDWVEALTDLCRELQPTLVVFDTLARATAGGDENSAKDMGRAVAACDAIRDATGAAVMLVHHTGKDGLNYRGSSAIEGAADTMLHLVRTDSGYLELRCTKQKEAEAFDPIPLQLEATGPSAVVAAAPSTAGFVETAAVSQLLTILNRHPETWMATSTIADEAGIKVKKTAQRRLDGLWEANQIDRRDTGKGYQYRAKSGLSWS